MYKRDYGTDWNTLDQEAAHERAFALGVAASLGKEYEGELERILGELDTAYKRSIIRLAYDEGKSKAVKRKRIYETTEPETIWEDLVVEGSADVTRDDPATVGLPGAVTRISVLSPPTDDLDVIRLPDFLER